MPEVSPSILRLASELLVLESAAAPLPESPGDAAHRVCEKLRAALLTLVGLPGYKALITRALAVAAAEDPALASVRIGDNGELEGLCDPAPDPRPPENRSVRPTPHGHPPASRPQTGELVVVHLLGLLTVFIGQPLTFRLVHDAWPDAPSGALSHAPESQP